MINWTSDAFIGGHFALDFINTVDDRGKAREKSRLHAPQAIQSWFEAAHKYHRRVEPPAGYRVWSKINDETIQDLHELREAARSVLNAIALQLMPPSQQMSALETALKCALDRAHLLCADGACHWVADNSNHRFQLVDIVALQIEDLLRSPMLDHLRECGRCTWLFIDRGRGKGRRWCNMKTCGNRAKIDAFRSR